MNSRSSWTSCSRTPASDEPPFPQERTDLDCDDFADADAAQVLLDADDSYEDALDPDGDGVACNEDDEEGDEPAALDHAAYIDAVWDEVDRIGDSINHFVDVVNDAENATTDAERAEARDVIIETSAMWVAYPETAPVFDPPAEYQHIDELYQVWVASVGESGEVWEVFWEIPDEAAALDEFNEVIVATQEYEYELLTLLAAAEADLPAGDDANAPEDEDATGDDDGERDGEDAARDAVYLDDIETAYLDLADLVAETGDLWDKFLTQERGTSGEAEEPFEESYLAAQAEIADHAA
jgi:hypothetical protein